MTLGLVCDTCDALSPVSVTACVSCGAPLGILPRADAAHRRSSPVLGDPRASVAAAPVAPRAGAASFAQSNVGAVAATGPAPVAAPPAPVVRPPIASPPAAPAPRPSVAAVAPPPSATPPPPEQRHCPSCGSEMPATHRFCGSCGFSFDRPPPAAPSARAPQRTVFFSPLQQAKARLVVIKGEGTDGAIYHLAVTEHVVGRSEGNVLFSDDRLLSPRHANFFYREGLLFVRDEGSANGVFLRIHAPTPIEPGQRFLIGEQLLLVRVAAPAAAPQPDEDGTFFYGSPRRPAKMHLVQLLSGGEIGMVTRASSPTVTVGREGNGMNFPEDPFISGRHAQVTALDDGRFQIEDLGSKNGTFVQVKKETRLEHGDYVFLGQQLLRVEIA